MRVRINRDTCTAHLAFCERCLGRFLREPLGYERRCFEALIDDGAEALTVEIVTDGRVSVVTLNEEERLLAAAEGWSDWVDFAPPMYRDPLAH